MKRLLPLLTFLALGGVSAQTLSIGPSGLNFSSGSTQNDVTLRLDQRGLKIGIVAPPAPPVRYSPLHLVAVPRSSYNSLNCVHIASRGLSRNTSPLERCSPVTVRNTVRWTNGVTAQRSGAVRTAPVVSTLPVYRHAAPLRATPVPATRPVVRPPAAQPPRTAQPL